MEALLNSLGSNGPSWALNGIFIMLIWTLIKLLLGEKDKRIADATKNRDDLAEPMKYIRDSLDLIQQKIRISKGEE